SFGGDFFHEDRAGSVRTTRTLTKATGEWASAGPTSTARDSSQGNIGLFIADTWQISEALALSGALRADWIRTTIDSTPIPDEPATVSAIFASQARTTETPGTGNVGLVYNLNTTFDLV